MVGVVGLVIRTLSSNVSTHYLLKMAQEITARTSALLQRLLMPDKLGVVYNRDRLQRLAASLRPIE